MTNINEKELDEAVHEAENEGGLVIVKLKKPVVYNGKNIDTLTFDFDSLTGADGLNIEAELQAIGKMAIVPAFSGDYLVRMAAKACTEKIGHDIFDLMSLRDYNRIRSAARSFLLASE